MMSYLHCPRCRLVITQRALYLTLTNCPRCLARTAIAVPLFATPLTSSELHARTRTAQPQSVYDSVVARAADPLTAARAGPPAPPERRRGRRPRA